MSGDDELPEVLVPPALDTLPIHLAILDDEGTIVLTNRAWREFGREHDHAMRPTTVGCDYVAAVEGTDSDPGDSIARGIRDLLAGREDLIEVEHPCQVPDLERWFLMRAVPFEVFDNRYVAVAHIDITERVESERDLAIFKQAVETSGHAIFLTDETGEITYVNPAFEEMTGYDYEEAVGRTPSLLNSGETAAEVHETLWDTITSGRVWEGMLVNRRKSGALFYVHETIAPFGDDVADHAGYVAILTEVTAIREKQQVVEKFGTLLRHDFRNKLNVIQGRTEMLEQADADVGEHAAAIAEATTQLLSSVEKGMQITSFLSGVADPQPRNVAAIVRDVGADVRDRYPAATVSVETPETVHGLGSGYIDVALEELARNGIEHNDREEPALEIAITESDEWVDVWIADDGPGIPEMEYEPLESNTASAIDHDTGFGLNLAYWIVRRSGGRLEFEENEPRGTTVRVRLPSANTTATRP